MDYTNLDNCIQILHEKPKWFFQKENIADKLQCFDTIKTVGTATTIYSLVQFLRSDNILIQAKAAETILFLFGKLKSLNDYSDTLKHLSIVESDLNFYRVDFDEKTYLHLLGIASLNGNGYVREKAVKELARLKNATGLKFIILRLGDWVGAVRKVAKEAVLSFLENTYIDHLLQQLSTIDWLLKVERVDLSEVHDRIIKFIVSQNFSEDFYNKIKGLDDKTRFQFYKTFLCYKNPTQEQILKISADKNFLVRLQLTKHLSAFDTNTQKELTAKFLHDQSARVRFDALHTSRSFSPLFDNQICKLLSDEAASVRALSRQLLKNRVINFADLYKQRIADRQFLSGSLLGLSETGNSEDLPVFEQYIHSEKSKLIVACLTAVNKFNEDKAKHYSLKLLVHPIKKVRDKAVEMLTKSSNMETLQMVRDIYATVDYDIKKTILKLYNKIGGWNIVGDLLLAIADENVNIQDLGWQLLNNWKAKAARIFTTPPAAETQRVNKIYSSLDTSSLTLTHSRTALLQDLKFYLR